MPEPKVVYVPSRYPKGVSAATDPVLVLTKDNWDDFGFKSSFGLHLLTPNNQQEVGNLRLIADKEQTTSDVLDNAPLSDLGGRRFDLGNRRYLSLGSSLSYYKKLLDLLPVREDREGALAQLHDVVYLEHRIPHSPDLTLRGVDAFRVSLLRETEQLSAYGQARQILFAEELLPGRFNFTLVYRVPRFSSDHVVDFKFDPDPAGPSNLSVLIGPNGTGKTHALYAIVDQYLSGAPNLPPGNFARLVAVSFSPFEHFPLKIPGSAATALPGTTADPRYAYCGFRHQSEKSGEAVAWRATWEALAKILHHDAQQIPILGRPKFASLVRVLGEALNFEKVLVKLKTEAALPPEFAALAVVDADKTAYFDVTAGEEMDRAKTIHVVENNSVPGQIAFMSGGLVRHFSAGQTMFVFMAFGVIAAVERNSLVLIDEPELYLHPNLETAYLRMLNALLQVFESYAIVATHSVFVAREVPARHVRVFTEIDGGNPMVAPPPIETFGADLTSIADLVFGNLTSPKAFEGWLRALIGADLDFDRLRAVYGKSLNAESLTYLRNAVAEEIERRKQRDREEASQGHNA